MTCARIHTFGKSLFVKWVRLALIRSNRGVGESLTSPLVGISRARRAGGHK